MKTRYELTKMHKVWYAKNRYRMRQKRLEKKLEAFRVLGDKCMVCGETDHRCLQIDHVLGDGYLDRRLNGRSTRSGYGLYKAIVAHEVDLSRYQLLCANDNWRKIWDNEELKRI